MTNENDNTNDSSNRIDSASEHSELIDNASSRESENPTLGTQLGYEVHIAIRRVPSGSLYPDDFAVNVYIPQEGADNIDVVRVDNTWPGVHIDRLYLPDSHEQQQHDTGLNVRNPEGAVAYLTDQAPTADQPRWREWVERYDENHGLP